MLNVCTTYYAFFLIAVFFISRFHPKQYSTFRVSFHVLDIGVYIPEGTEVLVICGPRAKDFKTIRKIDNKLGEDCAIILVNARVDVVEKVSSKSLTRTRLDDGDASQPSKVSRATVEETKKTGRKKNKRAFTDWNKSCERTDAEVIDIETKDHSTEENGNGNGNGEEELNALTATCFVNENQNWVRASFENVFTYAPPVVGSSKSSSSSNGGAKAEQRELLLFHEFRDRWYVAEKASGKASGAGFMSDIQSSVVGSTFTTLLESENRPSAETIAASLSK